MKKQITKYSIFLFGLLSIFSFNLSAQSVGPGRVDARFGVDGDLSTDTSLNGGATSGTMKPADDWFYCPNVKVHQGGFGVIDTTGAAALKAYLQASAANRRSLVFTRGMAVPKLTRSGTYILLDALYARDQVDVDKTTINTAGGAKVTDDPGTWNITSSNPSGKTDILEFYSHVRRKGLTVNDSLFFFFGVGVYGTTGSKELSAELFVNDVKLDTTLNQLTGLGTQGGRVAWQFTNAGNVASIGDMIVGITYNPSGGGSFILEPKIWMRRGTWDSFAITGANFFTHPANFKLGAFDAQTAGVNGYGYAHIEPSGGASTVVAQGTANNISTCLAAPWGTAVPTGPTWSSTYDNNQFVELDINLTALGVDPSLFDGIDPCTVPYRSIVFYSHSSASTSSAPKDFAGPYPFWRYPRVISDIKGMDTISCYQTTATLKADSAYSLAWYKWTGLDGGNIVSYNADSTEIVINKGGKYILESAPLRGCFTQKDTVVILQDTRQPAATANAYDTLILGSVYAVQIYGGDPDSTAKIMSVDSVIFGPSKGLIYNWTGKNGFTSTVRNPISSDSGFYKLIVTEVRNGCSDTATTILVTLPVEFGYFNCYNTNAGTMLKWSTLSESGGDYFDVQQFKNGKFESIATVDATGNSNSVVEYEYYVKSNELNSSRVFRVGMVALDGAVYYTDPCVTMVQRSEQDNSTFIFPNPASNKLYVANQSKAETVVGYQLTDLSGRTVQKGSIAFTENGIATIQLNNLKPGVYLVKTGDTYDDIYRFVKE